MKKITRRTFLKAMGLTGGAAALAACGGNGGTASSSTASNDTPIVVGYSPFNSKFSPFFSETAYDQDAYSVTQLGLLSSDRMGAIIYKGIEGETIAYNGTDYTYYGPADLVVTENADGTVDYDFTLREDIKFSDGEPVTIDDVIFSMYVFCDPTYDGSTTLFTQPIKGMQEYRSGMDTLFNLMVKAGRDNTDFTYWTADEQTAFWADLDQAGAAFAQEIVDYCVSMGYGADSSDVATAAGAWGFTGLAADATAADFFAMMCEAYGWDLASLSSTETAGSSLFDLMTGYSNYTKGVQTGNSAANISGIVKTGKNTLRVTTTEVNATVIYQLGVAIAPMHYYGDKSLYNYEANQFGFPKGDLSLVRAKTTQPMGAGPYKFIKFENGVINYEANELYYQGAPKTKYMNFQQCTTDDDKLNGVLTGTVDITDPSFSNNTVTAICEANSNGETSGDKVTTCTVDNLGYGYIGISANSVNVGGEPGSEASKNLRKAIATVFSIYREVSVRSYYGERASVINYPISNTSWAAPQATDDGYKVAFSVDVNGNDIYTSAMTDEEKQAAALQAALGFFQAAGYTVTDGKLTAAPAGASLEYEIQIPADGSGDHPTFMVLTNASDALKTIGFNLIVTDLTNSSELWTGIEAGTVPMWAAAWGATVDPDMYQIYYSGIESGLAAGGSNYMYDICDPELDQLIMDARSTTDQAARKVMYKAALDIVVDWAVEVPVYQRQNAVIYSTERVNGATFTPDVTTFYTWLSECDKVEMN